MSKIAEEIALKKYPVDICGYTVECRVGAKPQPQDWNEIRRTHFQEGYEQAEKDLADVAQFSSGPDGFFYGKGYQQAKKDLGWISVKEKLPPEDEEVIVLTNEANGHTLPIACHLCFAHIVSDKTMFVDYDGWNIPQVKYWMPCPELPEK